VGAVVVVVGTSAVVGAVDSLLVGAAALVGADVRAYVVGPLVIATVGAEVGVIERAVEGAAVGFDAGAAMLPQAMSARQE